MAPRPLNVSQFIANLNSIDDSLDSYTTSPTSSGSSSSPGNTHNGHGLNQSHTHVQHSPDDDLSIFSNTHFFDFDMGCSTDIAATVDDLLMQQEKQLQNAKPLSSSSKTSPSAVSGNSSSHQSLHSELTFSSPLDDLQQYSLANELLPADTSYLSKTHTISGSSENSHQNFGKLSHSIPTQPRLSHIKASPALNSIINTNQRHISLTQAEFVSPNSYNLSPISTSVSSTPASSTSSISTPSQKRRKTSVSASVEVLPEDNNEVEPEMDEASRALAEEDKRRRNTAASARFRIKKKLREQQMERTAKELQDKVQSLETKIVQLEMENKWLKNLVVEKNEARDVSDLLDMKSKILASRDVKSEKN